MSILSVNAILTKISFTNYYGDYQGEMWGTYIHENDFHYVAIVPNVFKRICTSGGFSFKAFTSWAIKNDLLVPSKDGKHSKVVRIQQNPIRCYVLKLPDMEDDEN